MVTYAFGIVPYTMQEVGRLDRTLAGITRRCCRLPRSMSTASILLSQEKCGIGLISLTVDYATRAAESITHALNDPGRLGAISRALLNLERNRMGGFPVDEVSTGLARYCPNLRKLQVMHRHGLQLTISGKSYDPLPPTSQGSSRNDNLNPTGVPPEGEWAQHQITPDATLAPYHADLANHPDGWFTRLLRHPGASPTFMAPLLSLGIRHIGQLVTATGTHMISATDLTLWNRKVTKHQRQSLNRLTLAICGVYPNTTVTKPTEMKTSEPLPLMCRTLPPHLACPQVTRTREGTDDIRQCLSKVRVTAPPQAPIPVIKVKRTSRKSLIATMQASTHRLYDRSTIPIAEGHLDPADVNEHSPPGSLATFWQQRQELTASLIETNEATNHWRAVASNPTCTWESFRTQVCTPPAEGNTIMDLPIQLLASLYDTQYTITSLKGPLQYKYQGQRRECYMASWSNTVVCKHHLPMITKAYQHKGTTISTIDPTIDPSRNANLHGPCLSFLTQPSGGGPLPQLELIEVEWEDLPHPTELLTAHPEYSTLLAAAKPKAGMPPAPPLPLPSGAH